MMSISTAIVGAVAIIAILFLAAELTGMTSITPLSRNGGGANFITTSTPTVSLCDVAEVVGDGEPLCNSINGDWVCETDTIGCFNIPLWNTSYCNAEQAQTIKNMCNSMNAEWTCADHEISCVR